MNRKKSIMAIVVIACIAMAFIEVNIQPNYFYKSFAKIFIFLGLAMAYGFINRDLNLTSLFVLKKDGLLVAVSCAVGVFILILGGYFLLNEFLDLSMVTGSLTSKLGVTKDNFLFVALYISFANSFLEEFFFRGFAFLKLSEVASRKCSYVFSSLAFALYHISMMIGWFNIYLLILAIVVLFVAGMIFNYFNEKYNTIYLSWLVHMFANFAINAIGFLLFAAT